ncbi:MAG: cytochrome B [Betaproteobacteria bacterium HGW-Betaproteobacteria-9]|nr:cytochrome b [Hydrogenophaga sp.]PKO26594.1 MAG: cytochrome B [Betaproteobacteria bacterium HGW-Betaproteobacteria-9]
MSVTTTPRYQRPLIALHWIMLLLLAAVYASIELRVLFPKGSDPRETIKALHFMLGLSVLALVTLRLALRLTTSAPAIQPAPSTGQQWLARVMHVALYVFMIGMPLAGWLYLSAKGKPIPFFGLSLPALMNPDAEFAHLVKEVHETVGVAGYWFIGLHAVAALFHHHVIKDNTLLRMLPARG